VPNACSRCCRKAAYSILKARGLQSRELRRARLEELQRAEDTSLTEEAPVTDVTPEIEKRIVEASLQNPDYGAQRLTGLLANEGIVISSAAVYRLLKHHGLQTRDLRQSRIELERLTEEDLSAEETEVPDAFLVPTAPEEPEPAETESVDIPARHPVAPAAAVAVKSHRGARWLFYLADVLLLVLLGYLGFLGYHAVVNFQQARSQPKAVAMVKPEPVRRAAQPQIAVEPLDGYRKIWERNLFNIPDKAAPAPKPEVPIENIALAKKNIGLKLVGTVVANDASYSRAIVHVTKTREQDAYRVGDQAGKAKIKKILRNKVIITTDKGDQLLTIDDEDFGKGGRASSTQARTAGNLTSPQISAGSTGYDSSVMPLNRRRVRSINIKQEEVAASLANTNQLLEELSITPFMQDDQPAGFIISKIPRGSVLTRMGLRNGYVVTQINDTAITGPEQAADFFRMLAEGGEVTIQIQRSRGVRRRPREINLNIE
jgi:type II secretion system protein C